MADTDPFDLDQQEERADIRRDSSLLARQTEDGDFVWLMAGPKGRRVVRRMLGRSGVFRSSFSPNAMQMAQQEGAKQMGYWLLDQIQRLCPLSYYEMMREGSNNE